MGSASPNTSSFTGAPDWGPQVEDILQGTLPSPPGPHLVCLSVWELLEGSVCLRMHPHSCSVGFKANSLPGLKSALLELCLLALA